MSSTNTLRAAVYTRISSDDDKEELGVARQRENCLKRVESEGWTLVMDGAADTFPARPALRRRHAGVRVQLASARQRH
jgi:DNA invertase Pin-like site-specific DNA recombinase